MASLSLSEKAQNTPSNAPPQNPLQGCLVLIGLFAFVGFILFKLATCGRSSSDDAPVRQATNEETTSGADLWYKGGTLTHAKMSEWSSASYANRLATSADFVARMEQGQWDKYGSVDAIRPIATRLEREITAANRNGASDGLPVSEIAAACWLLINR